MSSEARVLLNLHHCHIIPFAEARHVEADVADGVLSREELVQVLDHIQQLLGQNAFMPLLLTFL